MFMKFTMGSYDVDLEKYFCTIKLQRYRISVQRPIRCSHFIKYRAPCWRRISAFTLEAVVPVFPLEPNAFFCYSSVTMPFCATQT